jgi:hypothetical protein
MAAPRSLPERLNSTELELRYLRQRLEETERQKQQLEQERIDQLRFERPEVSYADIKNKHPQQFNNASRVDSLTSHQLYLIYFHVHSKYTTAYRTFRKIKKGTYKGPRKAKTGRVVEEAIDVDDTRDEQELLGSMTPEESEIEEESEEPEATDATEATSNDDEPETQETGPSQRQEKRQHVYVSPRQTRSKTSGTQEQPKSISNCKKSKTSHKTKSTKA